MTEILVSFLIIRGTLSKTDYHLKFLPITDRRGEMKSTTRMTEKMILEELADFAAELSFQEIPKHVLRQANRCVLDLLGCVYGALSIYENHNLLELALMTNPKPEATVWGTGQKAGMAEAALAHGCLGYHLEYDDGISLGAHWGSETIPAILAAAECLGQGGEEFITAVVVAYEVGNRISRAFSSGMLAGGIHFPCAMGAFGAAAGVARIMGLTAAETSCALGNACLSPIAPYGPAFSGASIKDAYSGWPNALGIHMVRLAQAGWRGPSDLIEGSEGLGHVLGWRGSRRELRDRILAGLGSDFEIMKTYYKPYPCCRWLHAPVRAILDLKLECGWDGRDIDAINVGAPDFMMMYAKHGPFEHEVKARYSLPYVASASALSGSLGIEAFEESIRMDPGLNRLADRVTVSKDPVLDRAFPPKFETRVTILLKNGNKMEKRCGLPWGPDDPPSDEELILKFSQLAGTVLEAEHIRSCLSLFRTGLQSGEAFSDLLRLLSRRLSL
jgi:2-methylcitrate dehydratase PrpD